MQSRTSRRGFFWQTAGVAAAAGAAGAGLGLSGELAAAAATAGGGAKPKFELGLASYSLRKFSLDDALKMTQRVALPYICLKSMHLPLEATPDEIAAAAAKVKQAGIQLYAGGVITMKDEVQINQAFEYAKAAGMSCIVGVAPPEVLPLVDRKVKQYDIKVAIHNHGPGDKVYPTPQSVYEKIQDVDPRIGLCIDIGHTIRIGADPYASTEKYADRLHDVHIKDVTAAEPDGSNVEIGRGVIDIPRFLRILADVGYANIVSFEFEKDADDPLAGLAESVGYVRGVMATM